MTTLNTTQITKIENFLTELNVDNLDLMDYVNIEDIDLENAFDSITEMIEDNNGFNVDIIYHSNAIQYLMKNDPSLQESIDLASEFGYDMQNINSEVLASLLASRECRNEFQELESEINDFFAEIVEEMETEETED